MPDADHFRRRIERTVERYVETADDELLLEMEEVLQEHAQAIRRKRCGQ